MGQQKIRPRWDAHYDLSCVRKNTRLFLHPLPSFIRTHGNSGVGEISVRLGNYLDSVAPALDRYAIPAIESIQDPAEKFSVAMLAAQLREVGLKLWEKKRENGELRETITTLKRQIDLLSEIATTAEERRAVR